MKKFLLTISAALLAVFAIAPAASAYYECYYWEDSGYNECWWVEDYPPAPPATPVPYYYCYDDCELSRTG
jgi:hypothetical protein